MHFSTLALPILGLASQALAATYSLSSNVVGNDFYNDFSFEAIGDPTGGRVTYVDEATAKAGNLTYASDNTFVLRSDFTTTLAASDPGRKSVRIKSNAAYTTHVSVFDVRHMPQGCGTWPAMWETDEGDWPNGGEIDIIEGVNDYGTNSMTLHTSAGCTMPVPGSNQAGTSVTSDCNASAGCGVSAPTANSYGPAFNANGGGWYATERTNSFIKIWFWPRNGSPPSDVSTSGAGSVDTDNWGTPTAFFPTTSCDISSKFDSNNIIINLTFCGSWAGTVYAQDGCPGDCINYVNTNPSAFANAYFDIAAVRVYE